jgi:hypothetical protein
MSFVRTFSRRLLTSVLSVALGLPLAASSLLPGADAKWRHFQSEHFELYSRNPEGESRQLLRNLELVHAIFLESYGFTTVRPLPITVYFFSRDKHFETYKPKAYEKLENLGTFYHAEPDRGIMTVAPLPSYEAAQQLAFGSYTHHLFRMMDQVPPVWYGYGVSGLFRNLVIETKKFEIGRPDQQQVARLRNAGLIPFEVLFGSGHDARSFQSDKGNQLFQDQSWALLHYLYFGSHKLSRERLTAFITHTLRHSRDFDADRTRQVFEEMTGYSYEKLADEVERYLRSGRYGYSAQPLPDIAATKSFAMRAVPLAEINLRLAELALRVNRSALGKLTLLHAAEQPAEAARIQEVLGADAAREGDWDHAAERWDRALAAGSTNPAVMHELAQHEGRRRFSRFDLYYRLPDEAAVKLRELLAKSIAAAPKQTSSYELLAWVEATAKQPQISNVNLVQENFPRLKEKHRTLLALAVVRMRLGDKSGAAGILEQLEKASPDDWIRHGVEHTRAMLEERPVDYARLPAAKLRTGTPGVPIPTRIIPPPR